MYRRFFNLLFVAIFIVNFIFFPGLIDGFAAPQLFSASSVSLRGLKLNLDDPLDLQFVVDHVRAGSHDETNIKKSIRYFLSALTIPDKDLWVNLSPGEKDRIMPNSLSQTDLGEGMLSQDYLLKRLAARITDPQTALGKKYWSAVKGEELLNKVWINADKACVYETKDRVFVTQATFKLSIEKHPLRTNQTEIFKKYILPIIEKEVNEGSDFMPLRQMYNAVILASWFKSRLKESLFKDYIDQNKLVGIDTVPKDVKKKIYEQYLESFKRGVYDRTIATRRGAVTTMRRYFSGGIAIVPGRLSLEGNAPVGDFDLVKVALSAPKPLEGLNQYDQFDDSEADRIESIIVRTMQMQQGKTSVVLDSKISIDGRDMLIRRVKSEGGREYIRVGRFILINTDQYSPRDIEVVAEYPLLIQLQGLPGSMDGNIRGVFAHETAWGAWTVAVIAAMIGARDQIAGSTFVDCGAGDAAIFSLLAKKLGAHRCVMIEKEAQSVATIMEHARLNRVDLERADIISQYSSQIKMAETERFIDGSRLVIVSNLPFGGITHSVKSARTTTTSPLEDMFRLFGTPDLYIASGGRPDAIGEVSKIFTDHGAQVAKVQYDYPQNWGEREVWQVIALTAKFDSKVVPYDIVTDEAADRIEAEILHVMQQGGENIEWCTDRKNVEVGNTKVPVTFYFVEGNGPSPFFRVGKFIFIHEEAFPAYLPLALLDYPLLIRFSSGRDFIDGSIDDMFGYQRGFGGWTAGVIAAMIAHQDILRNSQFVDFGAGASGIFSLVASSLGAKDIVLVEKNEAIIPALKENLARNNFRVPDSKILRVHSSDIARGVDLSNERHRVIAYNLPGGGIEKIVYGDKADVPLESILSGFGLPRLLIAAGGDYKYNMRKVRQFLDVKGAVTSGVLVSKRRLAFPAIGSLVIVGGFKPQGSLDVNGGIEFKVDTAGKKNIWFNFLKQENMLKTLPGLDFSIQDIIYNVDLKNI